MFQTVATIGSGSFGEVLKVHEHKNNRHFAMKIFKRKKNNEMKGLMEIKINIDYLYKSKFVP